MYAQTKAHALAIRSHESVSNFPRLCMRKKIRTICTPLSRSLYLIKAEKYKKSNNYETAADRGERFFIIIYALRAYYALESVWFFNFYTVSGLRPVWRERIVWFAHTLYYYRH